ncbi:MAG: hypothetical protein ACF8MF_06705 [Phycisphaerales bacterium JB052]
MSIDFAKDFTGEQIHLAIERAASLIEQGYYQTSRKHRTVARLPDEPKDPRHILAEASNSPARMLADPALAAHCYLCVYAPAELKEDLSPLEFHWFRRLGGESVRGTRGAWAIEKRIKEK